MTARIAVDRGRVDHRIITAGDLADIETFSCGDADLDGFLREDALRLDEARVARTYLVRYAGALVGYVLMSATIRRFLEAPVKNMTLCPAWG